MSLLVGCPVILPPRRDVLASWTHRPHLLVINGAEAAWIAALEASELPDGIGRRGLSWMPHAMESPAPNLGVAASWNLIFRCARDGGYSHVALVSQGLVLDGGTARLVDLVDEWADWRGLLTDFAWRCIVLSVKLWEQVGPFDERFLAYYEDNDYVRRLQLLGLHTAQNPIPKLSREVLGGTATEAGALTSGAIDSRVYGESGRRYVHKWGGAPGHETLTEPRPPAE